MVVEPDEQEMTEVSVRRNPLTMLIVFYVMNALVVAFFYWFFAEMNYFSLDGYIKGVVAGGPIAAFIFFATFCGSLLREIATAGNRGYRARWAGWQVGNQI